MVPGGYQPRLMPKPVALCLLQSGLVIVVFTACNLANETLFYQLAPVAALPCSNEERGSEA